MYWFLERLPNWGHYKTALVMDEEWARRILELEQSGQQVAPAADPDKISPLGYTPELAYLAVIADRQLAIRNAIIAVNTEGGNEPPFTPLPRPTTVLDELRERHTLDELLDIDRQIRGG